MTVTYTPYSVTIFDSGFTLRLLGTDMYEVRKAEGTTDPQRGNTKVDRVIEILRTYGPPFVLNLASVEGQARWTNDDAGAANCLADLGPIVRAVQPGGGSVTPKNSIEFNLGELQLVGDELAPSGLKYYGTDIGSVLGYHDLPVSAGDVAGPASSVNNNVVLFNGVTGKIIKDAGFNFTEGVEQNVLDDYAADVKMLTATGGGVPVQVKGLTQGDGVIPSSVTGNVRLDLFFSAINKIWFGGALGIPQEGNLSTTSLADAVVQGLSTGKIDLSWIPDTILGQVRYIGVWNATTNTPTLANPPALSTKGEFYITSVAGTQFGISFAIGDWIISDGTQWSKVDNTDAVTSVFGRIGAVLAAASDYDASQVDNDSGVAGAFVSNALDWLNANKQALNAALTTISGLTPANDDFMQYKAGAWANRTLAQVRTDLGCILNTLLTTKGDIIAATSASTPARVGVGVNNQVLTARSGATPGVAWEYHERDVVILAGSTTFTDHTNAAQLLTIANPGLFIARRDLTKFTEVMFTGRVFVGSASGNSPRVILRYYTSASTTVGDYLDIGTSEVSFSMSAAGVPVSGWIPLAAGAQITDCYITGCSAGGNGTADPQAALITAIFR